MCGIMNNIVSTNTSFFLKDMKRPRLEEGQNVNMHYRNIMNTRRDNDIKFKSKGIKSHTHTHIYIYCCFTSQS